MIDRWLFRGLCLAPDDSGGGAAASDSTSADASSTSAGSAAAQSSGSGAGSSTASSSASPSAESPSVDLVAVRDLVLKANPDVIPEMIAGDSFDAMMQSVGPARDAYKRIVDGMNAQRRQHRAARAGWWWPASVRRQHRGAVAVGQDRRGPTPAEQTRLAVRLPWCARSPGRLPKLQASEGGREPT